MRDHFGGRPGLFTAVLSALGLAVLVSMGHAQSPSPSPSPGLGAGAGLAEEHWRLPLAPQGEAPPRWSDVERSLAPRSCGQCHGDQLQQWRTSLHAGAFSPGLVGQLLTFDAEQTASCMKCHAPLAEQHQDFEAARQRGEADDPERRGLAASGNGCAGCHVRGHRRSGPPGRDDGATGQSDEGGPHGGVYRAAWFEESEFCAACHQFPQEYAVNGKPLQNTLAEWRASPHAARGITCQGCHMPGRKHLWRGIHDPETVASGVTARFSADGRGASFQLSNSGVGHAFPTYITPKVVMRAVALDSQGRPLPETAAWRDIQRVVDYTGGQWVERSDSRLLPGQSATLRLPWKGSRRITMWLEVYPDDYYDHQVYDALLTGLPAGGPAARLIAKADKRAAASRYRLFETELRRPD
ncbi:MAG: multiheme c-type cytochrome [Rhodospirillales bacterium]|jgi:hypothetical protein|nr:multiheme c-type cytochrome [Rhodospirillales bacterium]MDP6774459.1 multiheme c-type cytochrome [Rhodospirillales bacterium]